MRARAVLAVNGGGHRRVDLLSWPKKARRSPKCARYTSTARPTARAAAPGSTIVDVEDRKYLDFTSGQICATIGHNHPAILDVLRLAPPLTISEKELDSGLDRLEAVMREVFGEASRKPSKTKNSKRPSKRHTGS